jgi:vacuolar protein sorting-associated protein 1
MEENNFGTDNLSKRLSTIFFRHIRSSLPEINKEISAKVKDTEDQLSMLGQPLPIDDVGKLNLLWNLLSEYCDCYKNILRGKYDSKRLAKFKDEGGYKIKRLFIDLLNNFSNNDYRATSAYKVDFL